MTIINNFSTYKQETGHTCNLAVLRSLYNYFTDKDIAEKDIAKNFFLDRIIYPRSFFQRYFHQICPEYQMKKRENLSCENILAIIEDQLHQNMPVPFINTAEFIQNQKKFGILHFAIIVGIDHNKEIAYISDSNPNDYRNQITFNELFDRMAFKMHQDDRLMAKLAIGLSFLKKNTIFEIKKKKF